MFRILSWWEMIRIELSLMFLRMPSNTSIRFWKLQRSMPASGSSKTASFGAFARIVAISIRFSSPPDRLLLTSRSI